MSSCSKGSRGLSVQPRVLGIFTETTVSPDPSLRQRPSRCAIRAGRNFALFLRFRRRRLSLHPDAAARVSPQRRTAAARSGSSPARARRSDQAVASPMLTVRHQPADGGEALEVALLSGQQRIPLEVRDHAPEEILESPRLPLESPVAAIRPDASAPEVSLNRVKHLGPVSVLTDREARPHLPSG